MRWLFASFLVVGCTRSSADAPITKTRDPAVVIDASPPVPKRKPKPSYCEADSDCAFDDPCVATACIGEGDAAFAGCKESAPEPGRCELVMWTC